MSESTENAIDAVSVLLRESQMSSSHFELNNTCAHFEYTDLRIRWVLEPGAGSTITDEYERSAGNKINLPEKVQSRKC